MARKSNSQRRRTDRAPLSDRFAAKVDKSGGPDACWIWTGAKNPLGYGDISAGGSRGRTLRAHRVAYELACGAIPDGLDVLHRCDNPPCVNPGHLFLGTHADNMADMAAKGRHFTRTRPELSARGDRHGTKTHPEKVTRGEDSHFAKLTEEQVLAIRTSHDSQRVLAKRFGVNRRTISFIHRGETWAHVDAPLVDRGTLLERCRSKAQLTIEQVVQIKRRLAAGEKAPRIARDLSVGKSAVYAIKYGATWKDVAA